MARSLEFSFYKRLNFDLISSASAVLVLRFTLNRSLSCITAAIFLSDSDSLDSTFLHLSSSLLYYLLLFSKSKLKLLMVC